MSEVETRRLDPARSQHYAISEEDEFHLRQIALAAEGIAVLIDQGDDDPAATAMVAILNTLSFAVSSVVKDSAFIPVRTQ